MAIEPLQLGQTRADFHEKVGEIIAALNVLGVGTLEVGAITSAGGNIEIAAGTSVQAALQALADAIDPEVEP